MCGICGILGFEDKNLLRAMCDVVSHRGPDDFGVYIDKNICLGHRRLSIIDLEGGHQPMHNEDESVWLIGNGEIYNYKKLMTDLSTMGHKFYTTNDNETIVHLYEEYGDEFVKKLRGMFAFALWDGNKKKLVLARDRLGIKPLYYTFVGKNLLFGSEIKSLLQYEELERAVDYDAMNEFLTFRYVPGPRTMFKGIKKLLPGEILVCEKGRVETKRYWDLDFSIEAGMSESYCLEQIEKMLTKSVLMRLMSDVPLGVYLSGGRDSSMVVAFMSKLIDTPIKTFTVGFGLEKFDDNYYAKIVAERFGTEHHELLVEPETMRTLPEVIWHFDEPIADPAAIPTYLLSKFAKKYVTVVLSGEGGDELFGGYEQYKIMCVTKKYERILPPFIFSNLLNVMRIMPKRFLDIFFKYTSRLGEEGMKRFSKYVLSLDDKAKSYLSIVSIFDEDEKERLVVEKRRSYLKAEDIRGFLTENYFENRRTRDLLTQLLLLETKIQLPDNFLMKVDKMTMAESIEARVPLLDYKLAEFVATAPSKLKLNGWTDKYIFRKLMDQFLPREVIKRRKARFFVPIDLWLSGELKDLASQILYDSSYFNPRYIDHVFRNFRDSRLYYARQLWNLLTFEIWHKIFIENDNLYHPRLSLDALFG